MTETIFAKLTSVVATVMPLYLGEAEVEAYPYASYSGSVSPYMCKDGVYKYVADVTVSLYSQDYDDIKAKSEAIKKAIDAEMTNATYYAKVMSESKDCAENVWSISINYTITQRI